MYPSGLGEEKSGLIPPISESREERLRGHVGWRLDLDPLASPK